MTTDASRSISSQMARSQVTEWLFTKSFSLHYSLFRSLVQSRAVDNDLYDLLYMQWVAFFLLLKSEANFYSSLTHKEVLFNMCVLLIEM